jgi:hypothetical protein
MTLPPPAPEPSDPAATAILPRVEDTPPATVPVAIDSAPFASPESEIEERMAEVEAVNLAAAEAARAERDAEEAAEVIAAARADTPADPPVVTVEPPPAAAPDPAAPEPEPDRSEPLVALLEEVLTVVQDACRTAGEPISVAVSGAIRTVQVNLPRGSTFTAWGSFFQLPPGSVTVTTDVLGAVAEGSVEMSGWTVVLRWSGHAIEETS